MTPESTLADSVRETVELLTERWIANGYERHEAREMALYAIPPELRRELIHEVATEESK